MKRIQRKRTKGWRMPEGVIYVGRPSKWGNPFGRDEAALESYRKWIDLMLQQSTDALESLRGKDLACWCREGEPCHADILLEIANQSPAHRLAVALAVKFRERGQYSR